MRLRCDGGSDPCRSRRSPRRPRPPAQASSTRFRIVCEYGKRSIVVLVGEIAEGVEPEHQREMDILVVRLLIERQSVGPPENRRCCRSAVWSASLARAGRFRIGQGPVQWAVARAAQGREGTRSGPRPERPREPAYALALAVLPAGTKGTGPWADANRVRQPHPVLGWK